MTDDQHPPAPGRARIAHASDSSIDERPTDPSDATDRDLTTAMMTARLPTTAADLIDGDGAHHTSEDDDTEAALELIRDAIVLLDADARTTALKRGSYEVAISRAPDEWREPSNLALHLRCITDTSIPNADYPGTSVQSTMTLWIEPVRSAREMIREHLDDGFAGFTSRKERQYGYKHTPETGRNQEKGRTQEVNR